MSRDMLGADYVPAFPQRRMEPIPELQRGSETPAGTNWQVDYPGMSLRDYFAAKAMQSLIALAPSMNKDGLTPAEAMDMIVASAWQFADAMIIERSK